MSWILRLIPVPVIFLILGLGCFAFMGALFNYENGKRIARETGVPEAVPVSQMQAVRGFPWFEETTIRVQIVEDLSYLYWTETEAGEIEFPLYFFVDPSHEGTVKTVLGAFSYSSPEEDEVAAYLEKAFVEEGALGPIFELTGVPALTPSVTMDEVDWAAYDLDVALSDNFFYIEPHFAGRDAILKERPEFYLVVGITGIMMFVFSIVAAVVRRAWRRRETDGGAGRALAKKGFVAAAAGGVAKLVGGDDDEGFI